MNPEKQTQQTEEEITAIIREEEKRSYIESGGGRLVDETEAEFKKRKEEEWNRMHPKEQKKEVVEVDNPSTVISAEEVVSQQEKASDEQKVKDEEALKNVRQELGLEKSPNKIAQDKTEKPVKDSESIEKYTELKEEMEQLIKYAWEVAQEGLKDKAGNWIIKPTTFIDFLKRGAFAQTMYDSIHSQNKPSHKEMYEKYYNNPEYENFSNTLRDKLLEVVTKSSKVRYITPEELIAGGQPDQAEGFVLFKGNALKPANSREIRFYINTKPEGVTGVAENLAKISDFCDQYGIRLQFKFRKELDQYDRSDTCVAYLYLPEVKTEEQKKNSDQWIKVVAENMARIPKENLKPNVSLFTEKVSDGIAYIEDSRSKSSKAGESYTSQIATIMGKIAMEYANNGRDQSPDILPKIASEALERLKKIGY